MFVKINVTNENEIPFTKFIEIDILIIDTFKVILDKDININH